MESFNAIPIDPVSPSAEYTPPGISDVSSEYNPLEHIPQLVSDLVNSPIPIDSPDNKNPLVFSKSNTLNRSPIEATRVRLFTFNGNVVRHQRMYEAYMMNNNLDVVVLLYAQTNPNTNFNR